VPKPEHITVIITLILGTGKVSAESCTYLVALLGHGDDIGATIEYTLIVTNAGDTAISKINIEGIVCNIINTSIWFSQGC